MPNYTKYFLAFNQVQSIGPVRWQRLMDYFSDLKQAWQAPRSELIKTGIGEKVADEIINAKHKIDLDMELQKIEDMGIKIVTILDDNYPKLLKEIYACPPLLYYYGDLNLNNDFPLAVVGTRKITSYGRQVTQHIVRDLAQSGLTIISGLALGVDACAHQSTLDAKGKTIAVLGSGIDQIYPTSNRKIAKEIIENNGAIISEFPLGTQPLKFNFPRRNRIISGLSLGTLVIEAGQKSGALITSKYSLEQNREVFAVPGSIYNEMSQGPNNLIKMGAKMVTTVDDILETLNLEQAKDFKTAKEIVPENEIEKILLGQLSNESIHVDKLTQLVKLDISIVSSNLSIMEMKGMVKNLGGQRYIKSR